MALLLLLLLLLLLAWTGTARAGPVGLAQKAAAVAAWHHPELACWL
jgi:hypothetical protein